MKFIPSVVLSILGLLTDNAMASNNIIFDDTSNSNSRKIMIHVFVHYKPGYKTEVSETLGININPVGILSTVGGAISNNVYYHFKKLESFVVSVPTSELEDLRNDPNILSIEEDHPRFLVPTTEEDSSDSSKRSLPRLQAQTVPYGVNMVEARDIWDTNRDGIVDSGAPTGANRKICIIDSGFDTSHEDLQGIPVSGYNGNLPWNQDSMGHGTHVAGTIAAI